MRPLLCALLLGAAFLALSAAPASAAHGKRCGIVAKGTSDYRVKGRGVRCRFARRWARAYLRERAEPGGFTCYRPETEVTVYCAKGGKAYWAERLDTRASAAHPGHGPQRIDIGGFAFRPAAATVAVGDTVLWVWEGPDLNHTVSADPGQAESFDSDPDGTPEHSKDDSFAKAFSETGRFTYRCRIHPTMSGVIEVIDLAGELDTERPVLARVRVKPTRKRIAFNISEGAVVLGRIQRRVRGRWRSRRDFDVIAERGRNRARLPLRGLAPGRYRVRLTAYDDADNRSRPAFAPLVLAG